MKFKVFGRKYIDYKAEVVAEDVSEALDVASKLPNKMWEKMNTKDIIEPLDIYEDDEFKFEPINAIGGNDEA